MYWIARKTNGKLIALPEKEALIHFKNNNIANRMKLDFIGVSDGQTYKKKQLELHAQHAKDFEYPNPTGNAVEPSHIVDLKERIEQEALEAEALVAKENGMQEPDKGLDVMIQGYGVDPAKMNQARRQLRNIAG